MRRTRSNEKAPSNEKFQPGMSILKLSQSGAASVLMEAIRNGGNVDEKDSYGSSALHRAARGGNEEAVRVLLEAKAAVDARDRKMMTPLHEACSGGHRRCVELLLQYRADPNTKKTNSSVTNGGISQPAMDISTASRSSSLPRGMCWEETEQENVHYMLLYDQITCLSSAISWCACRRQQQQVFAQISNRTECARALLDKAASLEGGAKRLMLQGDCGDSIPLHEAAAGGHAKLVELLVDRDSPVDSQDKHGRTSLLCASEERHLETVRFLIQKGALLQREHPQVIAALEGKPASSIQPSFLQQAVAKVSPVANAIFQSLEENSNKEVKEQDDVPTGKQRRKASRQLRKQRAQEENLASTENNPILNPIYVNRTRSARSEMSRVSVSVLQVN
ncbi:hypothetical protein GUITHDRAFT_108854 [Guillardia theta CCMP2712]|uniref:Uncharacterized protein n=1 Tax=Guillardia theta (strain CCMP2712) TaxID=905079 RepID=L1J9I2_GUITC|nr:hypothetical protein GUITHDRAFT_108854 [Guillardia theta CCMP2712]EKX45213.1 hypothetical protein GUITHDRAFT_108854 [Guillardia theta CCMP2712]|eukprot:XP_005832193.1 hypothetical protein GUITHDRAFT_108854 [Guillardia theta CCMP2712]